MCQNYYSTLNKLCTLTLGRSQVQEKWYFRSLKFYSENSQKIWKNHLKIHPRPLISEFSPSNPSKWLTNHTFWNWHTKRWTKSLDFWEDLFLEPGSTWDWERSSVANNLKPGGRRGVVWTLDSPFPPSALASVSIKKCFPPILKKALLTKASPSKPQWFCIYLFCYIFGVKDEPST